MIGPVPVGAVFFAFCTLVAVAPLRRPRALAVLSWICSFAVNELPIIFLCLVAASTALAIADGDVESTGSWIALVLSALTALGLLVVIRRASRSGAVVDHAMDDGLGAGWRSTIDPAIATRLRRHLPWATILLAPWIVRRHDVVRTANIAYGDDGKSNLLDVYRHRSRPSGAPTLIHLHGGRFRTGKKNHEARPLIYHLASRGWTCISANYHLTPTPGEGFPQHLVDVKQVIAWVHAHGDEHGIDQDALFVAGSSAGAHLTAMAALTANDARFQPGFEDVDTSIDGAIGLYGYYGELGGDEQPPTTPLAYVNPDAPPFFVAHGDHDTYTPVEGARLLVDRLRATSSNPVVYAELPGGQHSFDVFHSIRFEAVVDGIERFAAWVRTRDSASSNTDVPVAYRSRRR